MIAFFESIVRGVDASLLEEWERMRDPNYRIAPKAAVVEVPKERPLVADRRAFTVLVRNAAFGVVRALSLGDFLGAASRVEAPTGEPAWTPELLAHTLRPYFDEHQACSSTLARVARRWSRSTRPRAPLGSFASVSAIQTSTTIGSWMSGSTLPVPTRKVGRF